MLNTYPITINHAGQNINWSRLLYRPPPPPQLIELATGWSSRLSEVEREIGKQAINFRNAETAIRFKLPRSQGVAVGLVIYEFVKKN